MKIPALLGLAFLPLLGAAEEPAPPMQVLVTPAGTRFGLFGRKLAAPAPMLLVFAEGVDDMDKQRLYSDTGRLLSREGWLYATVDIPAHGRDHENGEPKALAGWAYRVRQGRDLMGPFVGRCRDALDFLIREGYADPRRIAACGTSR